LIAVASCGGNTPFSGDSHHTAGTRLETTVTTVADTAAAAPQLTYKETAEDAAAWVQLEISPGRPGVDYDPQHIMLRFLPGAQLPAGWVPAGPAAAAAVAASASPALLQDPRFPPLAAAVAARYGLQVDTQIYCGSERLASFRVPEGLSTAAVLARLRSEGQGLVAHCVFTPLRHYTYTPNDPDFLAGNSAGSDYSPQWGHHRVKAESAWDYTLGDPSVIIAVCDTGCRLTHQQLVGQVLNPAVAYPGQHCDVANGDDNVTDQDGHGTYIAGLCVAKPNDGVRIVGLAPGCRVLPIKISNGGTTGDDKIAQGCRLADNLGAQVINLSWGGPNADPVLASMVSDIKSNGTFLAIAAGNDNTTAKDYPGFYSDICVGATGDGFPGSGVDNRAPYSNYGTYVDLAAPGSFLKSTTFNSDTSYSAAPNYESGTSFATPLVASGAALLLSYDPTLTRTQLLTVLKTTGDPTTNFQNSTEGTPVLRMNLASAFDDIAHVRVSAPQLARLVQNGMLSLTPAVNSRAKSVDCLLNGDLVSTLSAAPWTFSIDTSSITFGPATVRFVAHDGADSSTVDLPILVDNTAGSYPLMESFNAADSPVFAGVDAKSYADNVITALNNWPAGTWTTDAVSSSGPGFWATKVPGGFAGAGAYFGQSGNTYGAYELDCLISRKVDLTNVNDPTLVFKHRYNVEDGGSKFDKVRVLVTADGGQTFTAAKLPSSGNPAQWSGYQADYIEADVDLADFAGQVVNVLLLFQSDAQTTGENTGQPAGWWVDSLVISRNYSTNIPTIGSAQVSSVAYPAGVPAINGSPIVGKAPGLGNFDVSITAPNQVTRVLYWLDLAPFGTLDLYDPTASVTTGTDFLGNLKTPNKKNQDAILRVQYFDAQNNPGPEVDLPVHLFNLPGDTDANGTVQQTDLDGYVGKIGLTSTAPGYSVYFDTDLDGTITEADAAGVGYNWGKSS
jgi:hypothetical protein